MNFTKDKNTDNLSKIINRPQITRLHFTTNIPLPFTKHHTIRHHTLIGSVNGTGSAKENKQTNKTKKTFDIFLFRTIWTELGSDIIYTEHEKA